MKLNDGYAKRFWMHTLQCTCLTMILSQDANGDRAWITNDSKSIPMRTKLTASRDYGRPREHPLTLATATQKLAYMNDIGKYSSTKLTKEPKCAVE